MNARLIRRSFRIGYFPVSDTNQSLKGKGNGVRHACGAADTRVGG
ncbi:hypothetical protein [Hoeflea sp. BAL378]|nr:hypothetical protein [Hoeflea sp. BAL378]